MKRHIQAIFLIVVFLLSSCATPTETQPVFVVQPTINPVQSILDYFPLKKNAYWVYQGQVKWTKMNSADVVEEEITWKMEVERVFQRNNVIGYELLGAPWDLAWYEAGKTPSEYGIIQSGGKYYRVPVEVVIRLMNEDDNLYGLVDENDIFLETPLVNGSKFCDTVSMTRPDNMYCWNVGEGKPFDASGIKGIDASEEYWEYPVVNATMPDVSIMAFIPGIGVSRYVYRHHGTVSEVDVHLIEYYSGE